MDENAALTVAGELEVERLPACPMCLFDLAWTMSRGGQPSRQLVSETVSWVLLEIEEELRAEVVRARMRETPGAEEALRDLDQGSRSILARVVVEQLAQKLARELESRT